MVWEVRRYLLDPLKPSQSCKGQLLTSQKEKIGCFLWAVSMIWYSRNPLRPWRNILHTRIIRMISMVSWYSPCGNKTNYISRNHLFSTATRRLDGADKMKRDRIKCRGMLEQWLHFQEVFKPVEIMLVAWKCPQLGVFMLQKLATLIQTSLSRSWLEKHPPARL